jgi:hypothetical protein
MKTTDLSKLLVLLLTGTLGGCVTVGGVFDAGFWTGIVLAVLAVGLVFWLISKFRGGGSNSGTV